MKLYDNYWKITFAWTEFFNDSFSEKLALCVEFIDENRNIPYSSSLYAQLQAKLQTKTGIAMESIRKGINQLVKMGFINYHLTTYHIDTKAFINAKLIEEKKRILSKIIFENSSLNRSVTTDSRINEFKFLIKTIEYNTRLLQRHIPAIMTIDLTHYHMEYIEENKLENIANSSDNQEFAKRKYNQISYIENLLHKLDSIYFDKENKYYYIAENNLIESKQEPITIHTKHSKRNSYSQALYKKALQNESMEKYNTNTPRCMVENLPYPILIASHIIPYKDCSEQEKFDQNNGILISKDLDTLFDNNLISFNNNGEIIFSNKLHKDIKNYIISQKFSLNHLFLNTSRCAYLDKHRANLLT